MLEESNQVTSSTAGKAKAAEAVIAIRATASIPIKNFLLNVYTNLINTALVLSVIVDAPIGSLADCT